MRRVASGFRNRNLPLVKSFLSEVGAADIRREKNRARELRRSEWWKRKRAAGICYHCQQHVPPTTLTMDHLVPLARGGKSTKSNLVPACKACNTSKKYALPWEWESGE
jgi:5-methylcytosine-specific restriction protein A